MKKVIPLHAYAVHSSLCEDVEKKAGENYKLPAKRLNSATTMKRRF